MLMEYEAFLNHPIEAVFNRTIQLETAPHWHRIFKAVTRIDEGEIEEGSVWAIDYGLGDGFCLSISELDAPRAIAFIGTRSMGMVPRFWITLTAEGEGTRIYYRMDPDIPAWLRPLMGLIAPRWGRWDLDRYFRELDRLLIETRPMAV